MYSNRKPKFSCSALDIIGMIFAPLGLIFVLLGIGLTAGSGQGLFLMVFGGIGGIFLILGILFLLLMLHRRGICRELFNEGHYVMATVTSVMPNYNVRVNGRTPYLAECSYTDPDTGVLHLFQSRNLYFDPTSILMDAQVPVYVRKGDYRHYYVDVDAVLPEVQRH